MSDQFFAKKARGVKRKRVVPVTADKRPALKTKPSAKSKALEAEISSDEDAALQSDGDNYVDSDAEQDARETAAQKRLRLARTYLDSLESKRRIETGFDAGEIDKEYIAQRLQEDVLASTSKFHIEVAAQIKRPARSDQRTATGAHRLPITCAVVSADGKYLYTASKDGSVAKWNLGSALSQPAKSNSDGHRLVASKCVLKQLPSKSKTPGTGKAPEIRGHSGEILSMSCSDDGKLLATGGSDRMLGVWSVAGDKLEWKKGLKSHKDTIATVAFRRGTTQCYTSSYDRTVKIFDLAALTYIDTLFGHQEKILDMDILKSELAVTAGGSDKSLRYWKVADESQLVFRGGGAGANTSSARLREVIEGTRGADDMDEEEDDVAATSRRAKAKARLFIEGSIECVAMVDDSHFISGGNSGTISLWTTGKKKPVFSWPLGHGLETSDGVTKPRWITSVACLPYADLFATGSWDGQIQLWQLDPSLKSFSKLYHIPVMGVVNSLQLVPHSSKSNPKSKAFLVAAVAQEHRLGRWFRLKEAKNQALVVELKTA